MMVDSRLDAPRTRRRWLLFLGALLALRVPSFVQPAGADQSLYAYVGLRMLVGGTPYLDAWDQKPPGIHALYALLWWIWPDERVVAVADLAAAIGVAALLVRLGGRLAHPGAGWLAACVFALLANPAMQRLSGVFVRSQCETFIALAVTGALVCATGPLRRRGVAAFAVGLLLGVSIWLKYNAVVYALPACLALRLSVPSPPSTTLRRDLLGVFAGAAVVGMFGLAWLAWRGAIGELWLATFAYNAFYSSEPYDGPFAFLRSTVSLPLVEARHSLLWWLGLPGVLLAAWFLPTRRAAVLAATWIGAAVVAIALNGRGLPQYFVQASPALALAAGLGLWAGWTSRRAGRPLVVLLLVIGLWRIGTDAPVLGVVRLGGLPGLADNISFDVQHWLGRIDRAAYLDRFGGQRARDKYAARDVEELAHRVRQATAPDEAIYVFGFSPGVYVKAERISASRFFWSFPVVIEFAPDKPGYGSRGVLEDLRQTPPAMVVLQRGDWEPDSETFFMNHPELSAWLRAGYQRTGDMRRYVIWERVAGGEEADPTSEPDSQAH